MKYFTKQMWKELGNEKNILNTRKNGKLQLKLTKYSSQNYNTGLVKARMIF